MRILKDAVEFKDLVSQVLTFDYLGALAASLLFPLVLVPRLGLARTSLLFGLLNARSRFWSLASSGTGSAAPRRLYAPRDSRRVLLVGAFVLADRLTTVAEEGLYADEVVFAKTTPYQRIVVTREPRGLPALPEREPAVLVRRRVPLPRGARAPGVRGGGPRAARRSSSAAATASRCARSSSTPRSRA